MSRNYFYLCVTLMCIIGTRAQFQQLSNTAFTGNIIGTFSTSLSQCSYYCQSQYVKGCIAYSFDSVSLVCQFFSSISSNGTSSTQTSGYIATTTTSTTTVGTGIQSNTQFTGTVIGVYSSSQDKCAYWCQAQFVTGCVAYSFDTNNNICTYFNAVTGSSSVSGINSAKVTTSSSSSTVSNSTASSNAAAASTTTVAAGASSSTSTSSTTSTTASTAATTTKTYTCAAGVGVSYQLNELTSTSVASPSDCCNLCGANPQCNSFSFKGNTCSLKTSTPSSSDTPTTDSANIFGILISH